MGDISQLKWVLTNRKLIKKSVLELGSKFYNPKTDVNYRKELSEIKEYVGADFFRGDNVDVTFDLTDDYDNIYKKVGDRKFQTVICCSVLEHVKDIYKASENISNLVEPDGILFISVPFTWEYHGYPSDYWRFTPDAIEFLFKDFEFPTKFRTVSSNHIEDIDELKDNPNQFILRENILQKNWNINNSIVRRIKILRDFIFNSEYRKERIIKKLLGKEYRLTPSYINMIGFIKDKNDKK